MPISNSTPGTVLPCLILSVVLGLTDPLAAQSSEYVKLVPSGGMAGDAFGSAVATDGALVAVGSPTADPSGSSSGRACLFEAQSGAQLFDLVPSNPAAGDQFGASIALDGALAAVGAPLADRAGTDSGTVYLFDSTDGTELLELAPDDGAAGQQFGYSVAMDGGLVVVGALGGAYLFDASTGQQLEELVPSGGSGGGFGEAVDIDGGLVVVGARIQNGVSGLSGAAYLFDASNGDELYRLIANNGTAWSFFGADVSIDGNVIAIGAPEAYGGVGKHAGVAYVFDASTGQQVHYLWPGPSAGGHVFSKFGSSVAVDGQDVFIGAENNHVTALSGFVASAGSVFLYDADSGSQLDRLIASDAAPWDYFGGTVAADGGVIVSGAARDDDRGNDSGAAYVFDPSLAWRSLGRALAGAHGSPTLVGVGSLVALDPFTISLTNALENSVAYFVLGLAELNAPFKGGTLVPDITPPGIFVALPTGPAGEITIDAIWPSGIPGGFAMYYQYWVVDPAGPVGFSASNAISGTTP